MISFSVSVLPTRSRSPWTQLLMQVRLSGAFYWLCQKNTNSLRTALPTYWSFMKWFFKRDCISYFAVVSSILSREQILSCSTGGYYVHPSNHWKKDVRV